MDRNKETAESLRTEDTAHRTATSAKASVGAQAWAFLKRGFRTFVPVGQGRSLAVGAAASLAISMGIGTAIHWGDGDAGHIGVCLAPSEPLEIFDEPWAGAMSRAEQEIDLLAIRTGREGNADVLVVTDEIARLIERLHREELASAAEKAASADDEADRNGKPAHQESEIDIVPIDEEGDEIGVHLGEFDRAELQIEVLDAVREAGELTGADPAFLMAVAWKESRFDITADAINSSARGLFQFTATTWMRALKAFGDRHGMEHMASAITELDDGRMAVRRGMRDELLKLRDDPKLSALMAAEFTEMDRVRIERSLGREARPVDLYMAHLLGISSAVRFIKTVEARPSTPSNAVVATAVRNNPGLFIRDGKTLSVSAAYRSIERVLTERQERYDALLRLTEDLPSDLTMWPIPIPPQKPEPPGGGQISVAMAR